MNGEHVERIYSVQLYIERFQSLNVVVQAMWVNHVVDDQILQQ